MCRVAQILAGKAAGDLLVAKRLGPCSDISDGVIGFHAQQAVEKSVKAALARRDVGFPMMAHDLDFLLTLAVDSGIEVPPELVGASWLTPWATTYEHGEASPGKLDRQKTIGISETAVSWCRVVIAKSTSEADEDEARSFGAIRRYLGTGPGTLADFEAEYGPVRRPDGEG